MGGRGEGEKMNSRSSLHLTIYNKSIGAGSQCVPRVQVFLSFARAGSLAFRTNAPSNAAVDLRRAASISDFRHDSIVNQRSLYRVSVVISRYIIQSKKFTTHFYEIALDCVRKRDLLRPASQECDAI